jgi:hypothetical protein
MNLPDCAVVGLKVMVVAPEMAVQVAGLLDTAAATLAEHEYHDWLEVAKGVAAQVPIRPVSVAPTWAVPDMLGATLFVGTAADAEIAGPDTAIRTAESAIESIDLVFEIPKIPMVQ